MQVIDMSMQTLGFIMTPSGAYILYYIYTVLIKTHTTVESDITLIPDLNPYAILTHLLRGFLW